MRDLHAPPTYVLVQVNADGAVNAWPARFVDGDTVQGGRQDVHLAVRVSDVVAEHQGSDAESVLDAMADAVRALGPDHDDDETDTEDEE